MPLPISTSATIRIAMTAVFTSLVWATTIMFSIYIPQTKGFFNIGESMIYVTALILGPVIGSFAGGVGSMLADVFLGYPHYAFATLLIKACEGGIVGFLGRYQPGPSSKTGWRILTIVVGLGVGISVGVVGSLQYSGTAELYLGIPPPESPNVSLNVPPLFWFSLGALAFVLVALGGLRLEHQLGWSVLAMIIGGLIMVVGYFTYQKFFLFPLFGIEALAEAEIPVNVGQMLVGVLIATPITRVILRRFPKSFRE